MMIKHTLTGDAGELSPWLDGRTDLAKYSAGFQRLDLNCTRQPMALAVPTHQIRSMKSSSMMEHPVAFEETVPAGLAMALAAFRRADCFLKSFFADKDHLLLTEHPNAMPASGRCPGQQRAVLSHAVTGCR